MLQRRLLKLPFPHLPIPKPTDFRVGPSSHLLKPEIGRLPEKELGSLWGVVEVGYRSEPVVRVMVPPIRGIRGVIEPISSPSIFYTREGSAGDELLDLCL